MRLFRRQRFLNRVVSFGGVGSSALLEHVEGGDRDRIGAHQKDKHCLSPDRLPEARRGMPVNACFLFGNPYHSVLSLFDRGLHRRHERAMSRHMPWYRRRITHDTSIQQYLAAGVDRFHFETHLDNWAGYDGTVVRVLLVKYEDLDGTIGDVLEFLDCDRPFEVLPRTSSLDHQPVDVREGLERLYGPLKVRIDSMPSLIRLNW